MIISVSAKCPQGELSEGFALFSKVKSYGYLKCISNKELDGSLDLFAVATNLTTTSSHWFRCLIIT